LGERSISQNLLSKRYWKRLNQV